MCALQAVGSRVPRCSVPLPPRRSYPCALQACRHLSDLRQAGIRGSRGWTVGREGEEVASAQIREGERKRVPEKGRRGASSSSLHARSKGISDSIKLLKVVEELRFVN